ncbi:SGNH/GDSL hydrolase family protein [Actinopolymorpha sp. B11F2]|uniref:SGNH/GDSL hydrolase family protein n=1 Tax=Actinopolymorpha sp. B11F2 TaxID=3160862 RepID=UPI0032E49B37
MSLLQTASRVLFIGDSITDAGRDRGDPRDLGGGYPRVVAQTYAGNSEGGPVTFLNRGISGNRVRDLRERWQADCLDLKPDVVSIMIGVNDTWRRYDSGDPTSVEAFERDYRAILQATVDNSRAALVLVEPFLLPVRPGQDSWREDLDPKIAVVRRLAADHDATLVPLDSVLTHAATTRPADELAADGVHPTPAGHALIAHTWLETVGP